MTNAELHEYLSRMDRGEVYWRWEWCWPFFVVMREYEGSDGVWSTTSRAVKMWAHLFFWRYFTGRREIPKARMVRR
jgi:hypothetical protein